MDTRTRYNPTQVARLAIAWLDELEDDLASAKVIHSRQEQDQALEAISEKLCEARSFFEQLGGSDVGF